MNTKAFALVRVSKQRQAEEDRFSLPAQRRAIQRYAEEQGLEIVGEFEEPGTSAYVTDIRKIPGLQQAVEGIERGEAGRLLFHESSRLARTVLLASEVAERLKRVRAGLINVSMGIDYNASAETRMMFGTESALNEYWSGKTSEHAKKAKREQFEQGLPVGKIAFGYTHALVPGVGGALLPTRKLPPVPVPEEAAAIHKAFEDASMGANVHQIAREFQAAGYKVRSHKGITYWQPQAIREMLRNRFYAGYVLHLGEYRRGLHEPIVSEELFWAAQRPRSPMVARRKYPPKLLRGVATCIEGHRLRVQPSKNSPKTPDFIHFYYREPSGDIERPCSQSGKLWTFREVDPQVEALFRSLCTDPNWLDYIEEHARRSPVRSAETERMRITTKLDRLQDEFLNGRLDRQKWDRVFAECQADLAALTVAETPLIAAHGRLNDWYQIWDNASPWTKNEICRLVFEAAVIDFEKRELTLKPWPEFGPLFHCRAHYLVQDSPAQEKPSPCCPTAT